MRGASHDRAAFLAGGGACADVIAQVPWSATSLGPIETWPASLTSTIANLLRPRQPMLLFWGPDLIQFYNDAFVPSFGHGKHPAAMGQRARECWADAWPVVGAQIEAVMSRGERAWHEDALVPIVRNGRMEEVFWTYSYSPAFDDRGAIVGTLVIVTETTARVLATRRLEALAQLGVTLAAATSYHAVFDAVAGVASRCPADVPFAVICDPTRVERRIGVDDTRAAAIARAGLAGGPASGPREVALVDGPTGATWPEPVTTLLATAIGTKGHVLLVGVSPRLPVDDSYRGYVAQLGEQATAALRRIDNASATHAIQRQRDNLLTRAPVATALLVGPDHVYQLANPRYCEVVGRDPLGQAYADAFPEQRDTAVPALLDRVYQTGEPFAVSEMLVLLDRQRTGTPEDCYFNFNLAPLRDEADRVYGMMAVAVDITDQVRARHTLERIGEERQRVLVALETANRAKDDFLAMLGHELRNPLAPIVSALELMNVKDAGAPSPERAVIERQVKHVIRLVDDLLDVSKITRGVLILDKRPVDLARVLSTAVETTMPLLHQRGHAFTSSIPRGLIVDGDAARLVQVVSNLLVNAARYTPPGGEIRLSATARDLDVVIEVEDNGTGIGPDLLPRVFETFVQGARSADRAEGGLGLGLAIVKNLVTQHGGNVTVRSDGPGRGSIFAVHLPLAAGGPADEPAAIASAPATQPRRILVVDDNEDAADLLGSIISTRGHDVTVVHHPAHALELVDSLQPEIALLDIGLPGMDGYELAARLRLRVPDCRLIALTGYGQDTDRARTASAGFAAHLVKPVSIDALLHLLAT